MLELNEDHRLKVLHKLEILDTPPEPEFDEIIQVACEIAQANMGAISLVDEKRQWFKAKRGVQVIETPRDAAFCAVAVQQQEPLIVDDARANPRFKDNPLVTGSPFIRFYGGFQLRIEGVNVGTLCVFDPEPKRLEDYQFRSLKIFAQQTALRLKYKYQKKVKQKIEEQLLAQQKRALAAQKLSAVGSLFLDSCHEMTSSLALISMRTQRILEPINSKQVLDPEKVGFYCRSIDSSCLKVKKALTNLRSLADQTHNEPFEIWQLNELIKEGLTIFKSKLPSDVELIVMNSIENAQVFCRPIQLSHSIQSLLFNALESVKDQKDKWIRLGATVCENEIEFSVTDSRDKSSFVPEQQSQNNFPVNNEIESAFWGKLDLARRIIKGHNSQLELDRDGLNVRYFFRLKTATSSW